MIQGHLQGQKSIQGQICKNIFFQQIKLETSVIPLFHVIFDWVIHFNYHFDDSKSSSRSKVNFKVKYAKI